jgi:hypothetical protein
MFRKMSGHRQLPRKDKWIRLVTMPTPCEAQSGQVIPVNEEPHLAFQVGSSFSGYFFVLQSTVWMEVLWIYKFQSQRADPFCHCTVNSMRAHTVTAPNVGISKQLVPDSGYSHDRNRLPHHGHTLILYAPTQPTFWCLHSVYFQSNVHTTPTKSAPSRTVFSTKASLRVPILGKE